MKRLILFAICAMFLLVSCSDGKDEKITSSESSSSIAASSEVSGEPTSPKSGISSEPTNADVEFSFTAVLDDNSIGSYDFENAYEMCVQAITDFQYARVHDTEMDFSKYSVDKKFIDYMHQSIKAPLSVHGLNMSGEVNRTGLVEFKSQEKNATGYLADRLYLYIVFGSSFGSRGVEFIIENLNGRLVISDWYMRTKDSFDISCRGYLDIKNDDNYWKTVDEEALNTKIDKHLTNTASVE